MFLKAATPKTRQSFTPSMIIYKLDLRQDPISLNRQQNISFYEPHHVSIISMDPSLISLHSNGTSVRADERNKISFHRNENVNYQNRLNRIKSDKENLVRVPGNSFGGCGPSTKELQQQISQLKKEKENICFSLAEALKINNQLKAQYEELQKIRERDAEQYQSNLDQFYIQFNIMNEQIMYLQQENEALQEQCENNQLYIQQLEEQQNFGLS